MNATLLLLSVLILLAMASCTTDSQRIRNANEAARSSQPDSPLSVPPSTVPSISPTDTPLSDEISAFEVRSGDCISSNLSEGIDIYSVKIVVCSGDWQYRVLNSFAVEAAGAFPGEDYFLQQGSEQCDRRYTYVLHPTEDSWALGDETVNCLQDNFGLPIETMNRLVSIEALVSGECFKELPEIDYQLVELSDCSGSWQYRILNSFTLQNRDVFPGENYIDQQAVQNCERGYEFIYPPSRESWVLGDRIVICVVGR